MKIFSHILTKSTSSFPFFDSGLVAGFPSPAEDYEERELDLHELLITHPAATFFVRVEGDSMMDAHIQSGDILVVDRSLEATNGSIVVAFFNGAFTVKRLKQKNGMIWLIPENRAFQPISVSEKDEFQVWGVVTYVIHRSC